MAYKNKPLKRKGGYFIRYEVLLKSPAYRDLKPAARCLLEEFQRKYRPGRQGRLSISVKNAAELVGVTKSTISKAFYELESHGFIKLTRGELWQQRKAREWRLTYEITADWKQPTDEWQSWQPEKKPDTKNVPSSVLNTDPDCPKNVPRGGNVMKPATNYQTLTHEKENALS